MRKRAQVCAWIAGLALAPPAALAQDLTQRELVDLVVREGPRAVAIRSETEVTRREQLARLALPNPGVTYSREGAGFTEFLQVEQELPLFGVRSALEDAGVAATAAAAAERDARLWMLRAEATGRVARAVAGGQRIGVLEAYAAEIERLIGVLQIREQEGEGARFDRLRAEQEQRDAGQLLTAATIDAAAARTALAALLPRDVAFTPSSDALYVARAVPPVETLTARAVTSRAELQALQLAADHAALESEASRRARRPSPTVFGGVKRADSGIGREGGGVFGISLSLPVLDTGSRDVARWAAERARLDAERAAVGRQVEKEILRAAEALTLRQAAVSGDVEESADELAGIAEIAYREGEVGILELLDAFRSASRARLRSIDLRLEARLAQIALERAVGDLLWP